MKNVQIPILGFAAHSGTGKTTLLTKLIPLLQREGIRVGLIKHCHHNFEIDKPEKDSYRLRKSGASPVMLVSSRRRAVITEFNTVNVAKLDTHLNVFEQSGLDLILVEGFKYEHFPKIELHRPSLNQRLLYPDDPNIIALATDVKIMPTPRLKPPKHPAPIWLDINQPAAIADFIVHHFLGRRR